MATSSLHSAPQQRSHRSRLTIRLATALAILALALLTRLGLDRYEAMTRPMDPPPAPIEDTSADSIERYRARLRANPDDVDAYAMLGLALLQQVRESGDAALYGVAESSFANALDRDPTHSHALVGQGMLALARHDFARAMTWGEAALSANPYSAAALGVIVDAQVEMGAYSDAMQSAQAMMDLRPGVASYTRAAYLRELNGQTDAAIEAMATAARIGAPGTESALWSLVQVGNLHLRSGDPVEAGALYRQALAQQSDYPFALAGMAAVAIAQGDRATAIEIYRDLVERQPMPEFIIPLMELYEVSGASEEARKQRDLLAVINRLNLNAGMDLDLEMALFEADWGDDPDATVARARAAYEKRPSIHAADALAWALHRAGRSAEAAPYSEESLKLGTEDALLFFHAGMIALAVEDESRAIEYLQRALEIHPTFSLIHAATAEETLTRLKADRSR